MDIYTVQALTIGVVAVFLVFAVCVAAFMAAR